MTATVNIFVAWGAHVRSRALALLNYFCQARSSPQRVPLSPVIFQMEVEREWLECILKEDDAVRSVVKLGQVKSESAVKGGDNFGSAISRVQLGAILGSGKEVKMSLILKKMPDNTMQSDFLEEASFFKTEIKMYSQVLPALEDVLQEQEVPRLWPTFLGIKDNVLIFSDLKNKNYTTKSRLLRLDLEHTLLAVRTLAIFHAASVVLDKRGRLADMVSDLRPCYGTRDTVETQRMMGGGLRMAANHIKENWGAEWSDLADRLLQRSYTACQDLVRIRDSAAPTRLNVLNHGDLWTSNLMFKYSKGVDTPIGVRFVDFQLSHYNSYAFDLIYFLSCGVPAELRRSSRRQILAAYTKSFSEALQFHGLGDLAPTLEDAETELERLDLYALLILLAIMPIVTATIEGAIDFEQLMSENKEAIAQRPEIYQGKFRDEVAQELLELSRKGIF